MGKVGAVWTAGALAVVLAGCSGVGPRVVINGRALTEEGARALEVTYGVRPIPGNYWYDARSGLYGAWGRPAHGFMLPGHDLGPLDAGASGGRSEVFVNGRELPDEEVRIWERILGSTVRPGRYWLDGQGNAGFEGNPVPTTNLIVAGRRNSFRSGGAGGDNFWSRRFSAGNYDRGNTRGYVSVPGHGPVGYGFD
jgi:hypothetical protein